MAQRFNCFVFNIAIQARSMSRSVGEENKPKGAIAVRFRDNLRRDHLELSHLRCANLENSKIRIRD